MFQKESVKMLSGNTPIVIIENNRTKYVKIGDWIDAHLDTNKEKIEYFPNESLNFTSENKVYIPSTDEDGNVTWGQITDIIRQDPSETLYKIETSSGRSVTVDSGKSLLVWNKEVKKFENMASPDVKVGDCLPITFNLKHNSGYWRVLETVHDEDEYNDGYDIIILKCTGAEEPEYRRVFESALLGTKSYIQGILYALAEVKMTYDAPSVECANLVSMLYSRLGLFTTLDSCSVTASIPFYSIPPNDVVLDSVVKIERLGGETEKKMYNLHIPSTLNFGLANGLCL
jgi:intein/homing endonuclease